MNLRLGYAVIGRPYVGMWPWTLQAARLVGSSFWGLRCPARPGSTRPCFEVCPWFQVMECFIRPPVSLPHTPNTTPLHDPESIFFVASSMNWPLYHQHRMEQHVCLQAIFLQKLDVLEIWHCAIAESRKPVSVSHAADCTVRTIGHRMYMVSKQQRFACGMPTRSIS